MMMSAKGAGVRPAGSGSARLWGAAATDGAR
jgi:hypothetical protein